MSRPATLADLADALDCFWNAALGAEQSGCAEVRQDLLSHPDACPCFYFGELREMLEEAE